MTTIICLSDEVIAIILGYNDISIEDIINFRCVCKKFQWAVNYDKYWEKKFSQRWPSAKKLYDKQSRENEQKKERTDEGEKSLNFVETGINCVRQLRNYVSQIIHKHYYDNLSFFKELENKSIHNLIKFKNVFYLDRHLQDNFDEIISKPENFIKYSFFIDEFKNLLTQSPQKTGCDLTERYYCYIKLFYYMRERRVSMKWDRYKKQPSKEKLLERIVTIMAQWIQPQKDIFYSCVKASLNSIAQEVLNCLREKHPDHSIFWTSAETFSYWENNNIDDNYWNEAEGTQIMNTLEEYIFGKLNFRLCKSEDTNLEYLCIDNVLRNKCGQEIILLIIYHSVARRLGLRCDVIQLPLWLCPHRCIFWKPKYATNSSKNVRCFNISFNKFPDCLVNQQMLYSEASRASSIITADEMKNTIFLELKHQYDNIWRIHPDGFMIGSINFDIRVNMLNLRFKKSVQLNTRSKDIKFAVGMIVTHRDQPTDLPTCVGVIIGWHRHVDSHHLLNTNKVSNPYTYMDICALPLNHCRNFNFTKQQTNYIILTEKNKMCYVEEDAITLTTPKWIDNSEIGRYFCKFEGTHYIPNKVLAKFYPQDAAITAKNAVHDNEISS